MSWDVILFNSKEEIDLNDESVADLEPFDFGGTFAKHFKNIIKEENSSTIEKPGFSIVYYENEPSGNILLNLYGEGALQALVELAKIYGWQIYDTAFEGFIDLNNPEANGFEAHEKYAEHIVNGSNKKTGFLSRLKKFLGFN